MTDFALKANEKKASFMLEDGSERIVNIAVPINATEKDAQIIFNNMITNNEIPKVQSGDSSTDQQDLPFYAKERNAVNFGEQALRNFANPFGFGNEIEAMFRAIPDSKYEQNDNLTYPQRYRAVKDELKVLSNAYQQLQPVDSALSDIGGMATSIFAALKGIKSKAPDLYKTLTEAKTKFGFALKNIGLGGGAGAIQGVGEADTIEEIPAEAGRYGLGGAAGTGVFMVGGKIFKIVKNSFTGITGSGNAEQQALQIIKKYVGEKGTGNITIPQMKSMLDEIRASGAPSPVIADLTEDFANIVNKSTRFTGDKNAVKLFLEGRSEDTSDLVLKKLLQTSGIKSTKFDVDYIDDLLLTQKTAAQKAYPDIDKVLIPTKELNSLKKIPAFKKAYEDIAKTELFETGVKMPTYKQFVTGNQVSTKTLRQLKTKFNELYESNLGAMKEIGTKPKVTKTSRAMLNIEKSLDNIISKNNAQYKSANVNFSNSFKLNNAYESGLKSDRLSAEELTKKISLMNASEKEAYRVGLISKVRNQMDTFSGGNIVKKIFGNERKRRAMEKAFTSKESFNEFKKFSGFVESQKKLTNKVLTNSSTADRMAGETVEFSRVGLLKELGFDLNQLGSRAQGINPLVAKRLNELLLEPDPAMQNALFLDLKNLTKSQNSVKIPFTNTRIPSDIIKSPAYKSLLSAQAPRTVLPTLINLGEEPSEDQIKGLLKR
tara:strand:+ start:2529 stop:4673 length:2145 start_codon:yes stop_codon:yes gene_type:complete